MIRRDTGSPRADAEHDFLRARRRQVLAALAARLLGKDADDRKALSFQAVVDALGVVSESSTGGVQVIPIDGIVGSVDRVRDFDPKFRRAAATAGSAGSASRRGPSAGNRCPRSTSIRSATCTSSGIGHHRVSVFRTLGLEEIEAKVRLVQTLVEPDDVHANSDLSDQELRRLLMQRVPVGRTAGRTLTLSDPQQYAWLAEMMEAWAARRVFEENRPLSRAEAAQRWYEEEFARPPA